MAVCKLNASIHAVYNELSALISADLSSGIDGLFLSRKVTTGALRQLRFTSQPPLELRTT